MANEQSNQQQTQVVPVQYVLQNSLQTQLMNEKDALPKDFNITRFVQNGIALLTGNETLYNFAVQHGVWQIQAGLMRGAYLGLDALNQEMYLVPYGQTLQFMASYKGMVKMCQKYSQRKIKSIYAKLVRQGDEFEEVIINGEPSITFKAIPFNNEPVIGAFAVCLFEDGGIVTEAMSKKEIEEIRSKSKAKNSGPWSQFWGEMAKKTVLRRLCKSISIDMDATAREMFESGTEIETDVAEIARREIAENENSTPFLIEQN